MKTKNPFLRLKAFQRACRLSSYQQQQRNLRTQSLQRLQLMEFQGKIWLSVSGSPVIPVSALANDPISSLAQAREAYVAFTLQQLFPNA